MHLLIVDDSLIIRNGLRKIVEENCPAVTRISEAENGAEGLALMKADPPQVCITDIRMPVMDGIEMIRRSREQSAMVRFIVLSGYAEFDYARRLLSLSCSDYLLKPVKHSELLKALRAAQPQQDADKAYPLCCVAEGGAEWEVSREDEACALRQVFYSAFAQGESRGTAFSQWLVCQGDGYAALFQAAGGGEAEASLLAQSVRSLAVKTEAKDVFTLVLDSEAVVMLARPPQVASPAQWLTSLVRKAVQGASWGGADTTVGCAGPLDGGASLFHVYRLLQMAAGKRFYTNKGGVYWHTEGQLMEGSAFYVNAERRLTASLEMEDFAAVNHEFMEILERFQADSVPKEQCELVLNRLYLTLRSILKTQENILLLEALPRASRFAYELSSLKSFAEIQRYGEGVIGKIAEITDLDTDSDEVIIRKVRRYIENNYDTDVTLTQAARIANMNPSYFSSYFKKATGENYVAFVSRIKIAKAKEMLMREEKKIYEISEALGYTDSKYFSKLFLKLTGKTPREYRKWTLKDR